MSQIEPETPLPCRCQVTYTAFAVLAGFATMEAASAARERSLVERRKHDAAVELAEATLKAAVQAREDAWIAALHEVVV
jgi:hypothetical protein